MINNIKVSNLRNSEFLQFIDDIVNRFVLSNLNNSNINLLIKEINEKIEELNSVFNKENKSEITPQINTSDNLRGNDLVGIRTVCEGYSYSRNNNIAEAARRIVESIDRYGSGISRMNYQAETSVIDAIIYDWENTEVLKESISTLKLKSWANSLKAENKNFSTLYQNRIDDRIDSSGLSFRDIRLETVQAYKNLCDTLFAYSIIEKSDKYTNLIDAVNAIIDDYNSIISRRESMKEKEQEA